MFRLFEKEESSKTLIKQSKEDFEKIIEEHIIETTQLNTENIVSIISVKPAKHWNEKDTLNWLKNKEISSAIIEAITPCDGALLDELYQMLVRVPEFFYSNLRSESNASFKDLAFFSAELRALFTS